MGIGEGRVEPLRLGEDAACTSFVDIAPKVDAPPVFVGYGLKVPEKGYDDFADLDVLAIDGISDAVRTEATILAAACDADNGRTASMKPRLATLPTGDDAFTDVGPYAMERLRQLRGL